MNVRVEVQLISSPTEADTQDMFASAKYLTNNDKSIVVYVPDDEPQSIVAEFTIDKARQIDVVDRIGRRFRTHVENYSQIYHLLSKNRSKENPAAKKSIYT